MKKCLKIDECAYYLGLCDKCRKSDMAYAVEVFCLNNPDRCVRLTLSKVSDISDPENLTTPTGFAYRFPF